MSFYKGAFLSSRSIFDSDVWLYKPPEYFKIFFYLYGRANHQGLKIGDFWYERGQLLCTYDDLRGILEYQIGYRKRKYSDSYIKNLMAYLRKKQMITTTRKPRGLLITVLNYDRYQTLHKYKKQKSLDSSQGVVGVGKHEDSGLSIAEKMKKDPVYAAKIKKLRERW